MTVAFIGLGIMGSRMAAHLLQGDAELRVYNRSPQAAEQLQQQGAVLCKTVQQAVGGADIVFSMLSTPEVVEQVFFAEGLAAMRKGAFWVDCTTVNPSFSRRAEKQAALAGIRFMDAPVAGSKPHAEKGELVFFAGGREGEYDGLDGCFRLMGKKVVYLGTTGRGSALKMLVNLLLAQAMVVFSETLALGEKLGLEKEFLLDVLPGLPVVAPFIAMKTDMIRKDEFGVQFPLQWMHKDLHLAAVTAYEVEHPLFLANLTKEIYAGAVQAGLGREDFAAVYRFLS